MSRSARVLLVEDNPADARLIRHHVDSDIARTFLGDVDVDHVESLTPAVDAVEDGEYDVVLLDLGLPESRGVATLDRFTEQCPGIPVVVLTGLTGTEVAVEAIDQGAQDYLTKDGLDGHQLARSLRYAIERDAQERALRRQNERLEEFASVVSHDIRNPLNVAEGHLEGAAAACDSTHLDEVRRAHERMSELIEDVLMLARQGATIDERQPVSLATVARTAADNTEVAAVALHVDDDLPTVHGDPERLTAVFENLYRNALAHGAPSDGAATVRVGALPDDRGFFVEDDGPGIPPDERDRVFESGVTSSPDGTGFGLPIVRRIVHAHDWSIDVGEGSDGGARFEVTTRAAPEGMVDPADD